METIQLQRESTTARLPHGNQYQSASTPSLHLRFHRRYIQTPLSCLTSCASRKSFKGGAPEVSQFRPIIIAIWVQSFSEAANSIAFFKNLIDMTAVAARNFCT